MAQQGMARRELIRIFALAAAASAYAGFDRWSFACAGTHAGAPSAALGKSAYLPRFFSSEELSLLDRLTDLIIPADGHPGAHAAGVAEFIDFMVAEGVNLSNVPDSELGSRFHVGLVWCNQRAESLFGRPFLVCTELQQNELLTRLAYRQHFRPGEELGRAFFQLLRDYTVKGYYTSRIGLEALDSPGLQNVWAAMPGCPHPNDPEHRHLPPPIV